MSLKNCDNKNLSLIHIYPAEVAKHQQIVEMVQNIMQLKEQLAFAPNAARRTVLEHSITAINAELNSAIDELYQVESQEVEEQV